MSVYKPKKGRFWHYDFWLAGERYNGSTGATSRKDALRAEAEKRKAAGRGELKRPTREIPTLSEAAVIWWNTKSDKRSAGQMLARVTLAAELVGKAKPINAVTFADIQTAIQKRRGRLTRNGQPPSNATVNRDLIATLRPVIDLARERLNDGVNEPVPFPVINWGKLTLAEPKPKPKGLSPAEVDAVIKAVPEHYHDFVRFMRRYGPRLNEMFFAPDDVDIEGCRVTLYGMRRDTRKGGDVHVIPILPEDMPMLSARASRAKTAGLKTLWYRQVVGRNRKPKLVALTYNGACRALSAAMTEAGVRASKGVRGSHGLRHTAGTDILRATGNIRLAQKLLGHASLQSTLVYAHALEDDLRAGLAAVSRPVPEPAAPDDEKDHDKQLKA